MSMIQYVDSDYQVERQAQVPWYLVDTSTPHNLLIYFLSYLDGVHLSVLGIYRH